MTGTETASPRPWRAEPSGRVGTDCLFDANGTYIGTVPKIDSALIVSAVNERDKLRKSLEDISELADAMSSKEDEANAFAILDICAKALEVVKEETK